MRHVGTRTGSVRAAALMAGLVCAWFLAGSHPRIAVSAASHPPPTEIRALWVLRTSLTSPASIAALVRSAREHGFNTLLVQVRGRGDAYYARSIEPRAAELKRQAAGFDPLETVLTAGKAAGLRVHAWVNLNLVSSAHHLPLARQHIVRQHPAWLMVPRELAQELAGVSYSSPTYVGRLARWTRAQGGDIEGLYATPIVPAAAGHVERVVRDLVRRYPLDGVHFDYARYPTAQFDYSRAAVREFRTAIRPRLAAKARRALDKRETVDRFAYPDTLFEEWKAFRAARLTGLMRRLRAAVRAERRSAIVSVAVAPDLSEASDHRLQDWRTWLQSGVVDAVCPMAYTPDPTLFAKQIAEARAVTGGGGLWAGIGAYRLTPAQTIENIQTARRLGARGVVLFSYDSLTDPRQARATSSDDYLAVVGRSAFLRSRPPSGSR